REDRAAVASVRRLLPRIAAAAEAAARSIRGGGRIVYVGAGSSGRLGVLDAVECVPTFGASPREVLAVIAGGRRAIATAAERAEDDQAQGRKAIRAARVSRRDFVCGISASSSTPFVLGALQEAKRKRAFTALICCNRRPQARRAADLVMVADTGPELV